MPAADPALWYARRLRETHPLAPPATFNALLAICDAHGIHVTLSPSLSKGGHFWAGPDPLIMVREPCPWLLSHELLHALALECEPERGLCEEVACNRFSWLLCSGSPEAARLLGVEPEKSAQNLTTDPARHGNHINASVKMADSASLIYAWSPRTPTLGGQASTRAQVRECRVRADAEGLEPARVFTDYGAPYAAHERPEGGRLAAEAQRWRQEGVAAVYVANLTRLGPSRSLRLPLLAAVEAAGLELRSLELPYFSTFYR